MGWLTTLRRLRFLRWTDAFARRPYELGDHRRELPLVPFHDGDWKLYLSYRQRRIGESCHGGTVGARLSVAQMASVEWVSFLPPPQVSKHKALGAQRVRS